MSHTKQLDEFAASLRREGKAERTVDSYLQDISMFLRWFRETLGEEPDLIRISTLDIAEYRSCLLNVRRQKPSYVNHQICSLRRLFGFLVARGDMERNPAEDIAYLRQEKSPPKALTDRERLRVLREVYRPKTTGRVDRRAVCIFELLLNCGLRVSELAGLQISDMESSERRGKLSVRSAKGGRYREVPLNRDARKAITEYLEVRPQVDHEALLVSQRGGPLSANAIWRVVRGHLSAVGLTDATPHSLRHTFATMLLRKHGEDLVTVAALLGHENIQTTAVYTRPNQKDLEQAVGKLEKW
jgi:site-specific recombinase XerD